MNVNIHSDATLYIDLKMIAQNYHTMQNQIGSSECAAVVKANAYGLGVDKISKKLSDAGCEKFFVANLDEAIYLREILPDKEIFVFHGVQKNQEKVFLENNIVPVLNDFYQIEIWNKFCATQQKKLSAIINFDTGMNRLGVDYSRAEKVVDSVANINLKYIMSHLACGVINKSPKNEEQLVAMQQISRAFPNIPVTFANSSGAFLGEKYHFDMIRSGAAIYGINSAISLHSFANDINPIKRVITLTAKILQLRDIKTDQKIGYGATYTAKAGSRIAIIPVGYADGYIRSLARNASVYIKGKAANIIGIISMDMIIIDVTDIPADLCAINTEVELIGEHCTPGQLAHMGSTIAYEILTNLGNRYRRVYS